MRNQTGHVRRSWGSIFESRVLRKWRRQQCVRFSTRDDETTSNYLYRPYKLKTKITTRVKALRSFINSRDQFYPSDWKLSPKHGDA